MNFPIVRVCLQLLILHLVVYSAAQAAPEPLKIGVSLGLTGAADRWSKYQRQGIELAIEDIKKEGQPLEVFFEDSTSQPKQAVSNFTMLVNVHKTQAIIGDIFSFLTEPMIQLANQQKVLLVSPATPPAFCEKSEGYFFSTASHVPRAISSYGAFLDLHPEVKRVALISFQDPGWGQQYRDGWRALLKKRGVEISSEFESADFFPDFKAILPKLLEKKPDAFFVAQQPVTFLSTIKQLKYSGKVVFANNVMEIPASGAGYKDLEGIYFVDTVASNDFQQRFQAKFNELPILEAQNGYEALRSVVYALQKNPQEPQLAMTQLQYQGVGGKIDFSKSCAGNLADWKLKTVQAGAIKVLSE